MSVTPTVSVVIPVRNGLPDVLDAVASALSQHPAPLEVIVVDDASTDGTATALRERFGDAVRIVAGRFDGAGAARNAGWRAARGTWVALLDADDLWFPGKLEAALGLLAAHPEAAWFFSDGAFRTVGGEWHDSWFELYAELPEPYVGRPVAELFDVNFVLTSSVIVRRDAFEATGGFTESMSHAEDLDLWIRLARRWPAAATTRRLVRYQHLPSGLTRNVEARLGGNASLFRRLAADTTLEPELRRRARRRAALTSFKIAWAALRDGRNADARRALAGAWLFPDRALPVAMAWTLSLLPAGAFQRLRGSSARHSVAAPMLRVRRVVLASDAAPNAAGAAR